MMKSRDTDGRLNLVRRSNSEILSLIRIQSVQQSVLPGLKPPGRQTQRWIDYVVAQEHEVTTSCLPAPHPSNTAQTHRNGRLSLIERCQISEALALPSPLDAQGACPALYMFSSTWAWSNAV